MAEQNVCLGCMAAKTDDSVCPVCGWEHGSPAESHMHLAPETILQDKYLIGRALGQGGFGVTYLAKDLNLGFKLAIKEYLPQDLAGRSIGHSEVTVYTSSLSDQYDYGMEKFLQEARTLAQFEGHPNIVSVRDFFKANGTAYIVMSYIEGITLKEYVQSAGNRLPVDKTLSVTIPILDALKEVHKAGILHRDISPDNIFITTKGQVILIDFGAARQSISDKGRSLSIILKPGYTPEEQYRSQGKQGPWTDIYALGATMYRIICGQMPPESLDRLDQDTLEMPSRLGIDIAPSQEAALMKSMAVRASDRFQSAEEFQMALMGVFDSGNSSPPQEAPPVQPVTPPVPPPPQDNLVMHSAPAPSQPPPPPVYGAVPPPSSPGQQEQPPSHSGHYHGPGSVSGGYPPQGGPPPPVREPMSYAGSLGRAQAPVHPSQQAYPSQHAQSKGGSKGLLIGGIVLVVILVGLGMLAFMGGSNGGSGSTENGTVVADQPTPVESGQTDTPSLWDSSGSSGIASFSNDSGQSFVSGQVTSHEYWSLVIITDDVARSGETTVDDEYLIGYEEYLTLRIVSDSQAILHNEYFEQDLPLAMEGRDDQVTFSGNDQYRSFWFNGSSDPTGGSGMISGHFELVTHNRGVTETGRGYLRPTPQLLADSVMNAAVQPDISALQGTYYGTMTIQEITGLRGAAGEFGDDEDIATLYEMEGVPLSFRVEVYGDEIDLVVTDPPYMGGEEWVLDYYWTDQFVDGTIMFHYVDFEYSTVQQLAVNGTPGNYSFHGAMLYTYSVPGDGEGHVLMVYEAY